MSAVVEVRKLILSSCYGFELSDTDTGVFVNLYTFQQQLQMSASARQRKHEQETPIDGFKAARVAQLDRDSRRGNITDCQVTGGLHQERLNIAGSNTCKMRETVRVCAARSVCVCLSAFFIQNASRSISVSVHGPRHLMRSWLRFFVQRRSQFTLIPRNCIFRWTSPMKFF